MYHRARHTAWRTIADETVLLDLEKKQMYGLNATAAFIWQNLEAIADLDAMLQLLATGGATPTFGRGELESFMTGLLDLGLVSEASETPDQPEAEIDSLATGEPPRILWREEVEQLAGTCAFLPAMNPLCTQAPFS